MWRALLHLTQLLFIEAFYFSNIVNRVGNIRARIWYCWHIGRSECDKQGLLIISVNDSPRSWRTCRMKWELQREDSSSAGSEKEMHLGKMGASSVMQDKQALTSEPVNSYSSRISVSTWERGRKREKTLVQSRSLVFWQVFFRFLPYNFYTPVFFPQLIHYLLHDIISNALLESR